MSKLNTFFKKQRTFDGKLRKPYYSIVSKNSGRVIDVAKDGLHEGTTIIWDPQNRDNQAFTIEQINCEYLIKSKDNKRYLTVESGADGARLFLSEQAGPQSYFRFDETSPGSKQYVIYTFCGKVLDVCQRKKQNGTQIIQWSYNGCDHQIWYLSNPKDVTTQQELEIEICS